MAENIEKFGETKCGHPVHHVRLANGGLTANIITYGASVQDLRMSGHAAPLVLGFEDVASYETHGLHFGAIAGRCINRIGHGRFMHDGKEFLLAVDEGGEHQLHGGPQGFGNRCWRIEEVAENSVLLSLESADGDMGYPGNLTANCRYTLTDDNALQIVLTAQSDAPTICNMSNHTYFNLEDGGVDEVNLHRLQISAENLLEADVDGLPTGEQKAVSGTQYDFRAIRPIGDFRGYDYNFCLSDQRQELRQVGRVVAPSSGIAMDVETTEAGLQLYTALDIASETKGLDGIAYNPGSAICLEAQVWPDAINQRDFPNVVLRPGEQLKQETLYRFSK